MPHSSTSSFSGLGIVMGDESSSSANSKSARSPAKRSRAYTVGTVEPALRTSMRMNGLLSAETGGTMVRLDPNSLGSGFQQGSAIDLEEHRRDSTIKASKLPPHVARSSSFSLPNPHRGSMHSEASESVLSIGSTPSMSLGSRNPSQALEIDLILENSTAVEGYSLNGYVILRARRNSPHLRVGPGKIRVVGFEAVPYDRHTFYQHSAPLEATCPTLGTIFAPTRSVDTYKEIIDGKHTIPFSFHLPRMLGAKGSVINRSRVNVRYIALVSFKYRDGSETPKSRSKQLVHFYRACHIFPYFDPTKVMSPSPAPLTRGSTKSLFLGGDGKLSLKCTLHRSTWVAGQQCWVGIRIQNKTSKRVKTLTLAIHRQTTTFRIDPQLNPGGVSAEVDIDSCETSTSSRKLAEVVLESGARGVKGAVTGKGWWCGVDAKAESQVTHGIPIPSDALSVPRSRLLEISYTLRVTANTGSLTSNIYVELPITIVNFISLYPPPQPDAFRPIEITLHRDPAPGKVTTGNGRDRAKSIPLKGEARTVEARHDHADPASRRPVLRSRTSMPEARAFAVAQAQVSQHPQYRSEERVVPAQDDDDSDLDEIADMIQSARLGGFADEEDNIPSSTSTYRPDGISPAEHAPSSSDLDSHESFTSHGTGRSRRLPTPPPLRASRSDASRVAPAAPAGPRSRGQSRTKIPSAFLDFSSLPSSQPLADDHSASFDYSSDSSNFNHLTLDKTPTLHHSRHRSDDSTSLPADNNDTRARVHSVPEPSTHSRASSLHDIAGGPNGVVGLGVPALHALSIDHHNSSSIADSDPSPISSTAYEGVSLPSTISAVKPSRSFTVSLATNRSQASNGKEPGAAVSKPRMSASTSVKARIAELERAGLNKRG